MNQIESRDYLQSLASLPLLMQGTLFTIPAVSGEKAILDVDGLYSVSEKFEIHNTARIPTKETAVMAHEVTRALTFEEMLRSLSNDISTLSLTEHQIAEFLTAHTLLLRKILRPIFFLCRTDKDFFIVFLMFWGEFARVDKFPLNYHFRLQPERHYFLIVSVDNPQ